MALVARTLFRHPHFFQDNAKWAKFCPTILKKIQAHQGREKKPIAAQEKGVSRTINPQKQRKQNNRTGNNVNPVVYNHGFHLKKKEKRKTISITYR